MADDEQKVLVCSPVGGKDTEILPGSDVMQCSRCGQGMFIAPSGKRMLAEVAGLTAICLTCALPDLQDPEAKIEPVTEEQIDELVEAYKK